MGPFSQVTAIVPYCAFVHHVCQDLADALEMTGAINLKRPDTIYTVFDYRGPFGTQKSEDPLKLYFGRLVIILTFTVISWFGTAVYP